MSAAHGDASARPVGNYLHGCDSSELISPRSLGCAASKHGTAAAYQHEQCRCPTARRALLRQVKARELAYLEGRPPILDATGTQRRLQALAVVGHSLSNLAAMAGCAKNTVHGWRTSPVVTRRTYERVIELYDLLADVSPTGRRAARVRGDARRAGWLGPLWWDDDTIDDPTYDPQQVLEFIAGRNDFFKEKEIVDNIAIERFVAGDDTVTLTRTEKPVAYQEFLARGVSHTQAAVRLKLSGSTAKKLARIVDVRAQVVGVREDRDANDIRSAAS